MARFGACDGLTLVAVGVFRVSHYVMSHPELDNESPIQPITTSTLALYVVREPAIGTVEVPRDTRWCQVVSDTARNSTTILVYWFIRLHNHNFSMGGALNLADFCVNRSGALKGTRPLFDKLILLTPMQRSQDMTMLANFARQFVYHIQSAVFVSPVVDDLLNLLTHFTLQLTPTSSMDSYANPNE